MPYYIGDVVKSHEALIARTPEKFESSGVKVMQEVEVTGIDYKGGWVEISRGERKFFDVLVFATGAKVVTPEIEGINQPGVFFLRNLEDAIAIKKWIKDQGVKRAVILGGGFIGLEMAESLRTAGMQVTILHRDNLPAKRWNPEFSHWMRDTLHEKGVEFVPRINVTGIGKEETGNLRVQTTEGDWEAEIVIIATGVRPEVSLARSIGVNIGKTGAIAVDFGQRTSLINVYAVGDCSEVFHRVSKKWVNFPLGDIANKQGRVAGRNIGGRPLVFEGIVGAQSFRLFDLECAATGLSEKEAEEAGFSPISTIVWGSATAKALGRRRLGLQLIADRSSGKLLGAQAVGLAGAVGRINALSVALWSGMNLDQIGYLDFAYAPPFGPAWDIVHVAAQTLKRMI